jgi:hypothetical protein
MSGKAGIGAEPSCTVAHAVGPQVSNHIDQRRNAGRPTLERSLVAHLAVLEISDLSQGLGIAGHHVLRGARGANFNI